MAGHAPGERQTARVVSRRERGENRGHRQGDAPPVRRAGRGAGPRPHRRGPTELYAALCAAMSRRRGRPVVFRMAAFPPGTASGLWLDMADRDLVVVEERTAPEHQLVILGHELWHMKAGHRGHHVEGTTVAGPAAGRDGADRDRRCGPPCRGRRPLPVRPRRGAGGGGLRSAAGQQVPDVARGFGAARSSAAGPSGGADRRVARLPGLRAPGGWSRPVTRGAVRRPIVSGGRQAGRRATAVRGRT